MEPNTEIARRPEPAYSVVVYDAKSGAVVQIHHFGAMAGVSLPSRERLYEIALHHAAGRYGKDTATMAVLEIDAKALRPRTRYRVSLADRTLVEAGAEIAF